MKRLIKARFGSPVRTAETPTTASDTLLSIIQKLAVAQLADDRQDARGQVISSIRTVLLSVKPSSYNREALEQLREQVSVLEATVLLPLAGRNELPPAVESSIYTLSVKVKEAQGRWERRQKRGPISWSLLADSSAKELQEYVTDIRDAQLMFSASGNVPQMIHQFENAVSEKLDRIPRAREAGYDSERPNAPVRCLEDTRTSVLMKIERWADSDTWVQPVYWVSGLAGIGKSAIARTISEHLDRRGLLGASFFFSRQQMELSDARLFIPTIAYQLGQSYPEAKSAIVHVLQRDPDVIKKSFITQLEHLILEPLRKLTSRRPVLLVADAFDECDNSNDAAANLLRAIVARCDKVPSFRLFVTSRPESYINNILRGDQRVFETSLHEDVEGSVIRDDIRRYLLVGMSTILGLPGIRLSRPWLSEPELERLASKAGKLFIWAAAAVRFLRDDLGYNRASRLRMLLEGPISPSDDPKNPFLALDSLYLAILSQATEHLSSTIVVKMRIVIGTVVLLRSEMSLGEIGRFLGDDTVAIHLARIQSIIPFPTDVSQPVQIYHPSFPDFITSWERCPDARLYVDIVRHEKRLALRCLDILNSDLSEDIVFLLKPTEEQSAVSKKAVLSAIPSEVQYACRFWAAHVTSSFHPGDELMTALEIFSSTMLLRWVVAMGLLGVISDAILAARVVQQWLDSGPHSDLKERFYDTERMMLAWSETLSQYPTQLFFSVLPFLPWDTYLARQYSPPSSPISILTGREESWSPVMFTLTTGFAPHVTAFTPDGRIVALASYSQLDLYENGLLISSTMMPKQEEQRSFYVIGATFTADGSEVVVARSCKFSGQGTSFEVVKYDLVMMHGRIYRTASKDVNEYLVRLSGGGSCVVFPEFMGSELRICVWRTDGHEDTSIPMGRTGNVRDLTLASDSVGLAAIAADNVVTIFDTLSGDILHRQADEGVRKLCISPDGSFLASWSSVGGVRLWDTRQGTLLATLEVRMDFLVFSCTNHLYMPVQSGGGSVCVPGDRPVVTPFPFPVHTYGITPAPDDSQIAIRVSSDTQVWSLKHPRDGSTPDSSPVAHRFFREESGSTPGSNPILSIDMSCDGSLLAVGTQTDVEIWDARIWRRRHAIKRQNDSKSNFEQLAFSPRGELVASSSRDAIIVLDVQMGTLRPTIYPFIEIQDSKGTDDSWDQLVVMARISFDSSKLAAMTEHAAMTDRHISVWIWDLPSGSPLHSLGFESSAPPFLWWSRRDQYLWFGDAADSTRRLNTDTFQEEIREYFSDSSSEHTHYRLIRQNNVLWINRNHQPILALPRHLDCDFRFQHGDRICLISAGERILLIDMSGLDAYLAIHSLKSESEDDNTEELLYP